MRNEVRVLLVLVAVCIALGAAMAAYAASKHYILEFQGETLAVFESVDGLTMGPSPGEVAKVVLGKGKSTEAFLGWYSKVQKKQIKLSELYVVVAPQGKGTFQRWRIRSPWPAVDSPDLKGKGTDITIEELEIVHEGVERVDSSDGDDSR